MIRTLAKTMPDFQSGCHETALPRVIRAYKVEKNARGFLVQPTWSRMTKPGEESYQ